MANNATGQGAVRYGLDNTMAGLGLTGQPQIGDMSNSDLGHFVTVSVTSVSAVPVPAAVWLFGSGLIGLVGVARRNRG